MRRLAFVAAILLACLPAAALAGIGPPDTIIVVVRHAEKATDDPKDPSLSEAGQARAQALAVALKGLPLHHAVSTQYKRTRDTAAPAAKANGIEVHVKPVDAANAATYAKDLAHHIRHDHAGQNLLVVGHSNTVPELVEAFTGARAEPMADTEFDRIYVVTLPADGPPRYVVLKY
jgi:broad specificity phosphatase PhoE